MLEQPVGLAGEVLGVPVRGEGGCGFVQEGLRVREDCGGGDGQRHGLDPEEVKAKFVGRGVWHRHGSAEGEEEKEEEGEGEGERGVESGLHDDCLECLTLNGQGMLWKVMRRG